MKRSKLSSSIDYLDEELITDAMEADMPQANASRKKGATIMKLSTKIAATAATLAVLICGGILLSHLIGPEPFTPSVLEQPTDTRSESVSFDETEPTPPSISPLKTSAVIALDVNPSMEIEVTEDGTVVTVTPLNEDALIVLEDMEFAGVDLDIAVNAIIGSLLRHGYLTDEKNSILISVDADGDREAAEALRILLSEKVNAILADSELTASVLTQTYNKDEKPYEDVPPEVSSAKQALISKIFTVAFPKAFGLTYLDLAAMSIDELNAIIEADPHLDVEGLMYTANRMVFPKTVLDAALSDANTAMEKISELKIEFFDACHVFHTYFYVVHFKLGDNMFIYEFLGRTGDMTDKWVIPVSEYDPATDMPAYPFNDIELAEATEAGRKVNYMTEREIQYIAWEDAGIADWVRHSNRKFEYIDGRCVYIIECAGKENFEYTYTIDAKTGEILDKQVQEVNFVPWDELTTEPNYEDELESEIDPDFSFTPKPDTEDEIDPHETQ